jgi:hypothetical protein
MTNDGGLAAIIIGQWVTVLLLALMLWAGLVIGVDVGFRYPAIGLWEGTECDPIN